MARLIIKTRPSTGNVWSGWLAEFVGLPAGDWRNAYVGKAKREDEAVHDLLKQVGYRSARKSVDDYKWFTEEPE